MLLRIIIMARIRQWSLQNLCLSLLTDTLGVEFLRLMDYATGMKRYGLMKNIYN